MTEQIDALTANGISLIELRGVDGKNVADLTDEEAENTVRRLSAAGIGVWSIGSPVGKARLSTDTGREIERFARVLALAERMGASCIRLFSFYPDKEPEAPGNEDTVVMALTRMAALAMGRGVTLCHENEKGIYGDRPERCRRLCETVPALMSVFDPANYIQCGVDPLKAWGLLSSTVKYIHIKDALPDGTVVPAGMGVGHLPEILTAFDRQGGGVLTLEPHLFAFKGLGGLSASDEQSVMAHTRFATDREAFDFAVAKLKELLERI